MFLLNLMKEADNIVLERESGSHASQHTGLDALMSTASSSPRSRREGALANTRNSSGASRRQTKRKKKQALRDFPDATEPDKVVTEARTVPVTIRRQEGNRYFFGIKIMMRRAEARRQP